VTRQLYREGTIQSGFKGLLKQAIAQAGIAHEDGEQERLAAEVIANLSSVRAEVRRELVHDLLNSIGHQQDETLLEVIDRIEQRASDPGARAPAFGLEGTFTVQQCADVIHDIALMVLMDYPEAMLAWAAKEEVSNRSTPDEARNFLRIANHADLEGRSRRVLDGIRDFAMPKTSSSAVVPQEEKDIADPETQNLYSDFPPLVVQGRQPVPEGLPVLPAVKPEIRGSNYVFLLRSQVRDRLTQSGTIHPQHLKVLFAEAAAHSGYTRSPEAIQKAMDQLRALPAAVCEPLLNDLLNALGEEAGGGAPKRLVDGVLGAIDETAKRRQALATWKDLSQARTLEEASFIIHDIARQNQFDHWGEEFRMWGSEGLRHAEITKEAAGKFLQLANRLPLQGRGAGIRDIVRAYASGDDVASWHRSLLRDYFLCFGTIPEEGFKLLFTEAAQHSGRTPSPGSVEDALEQLLSLPASVCARWLDELLYAMAEEAKEPSDSFVDQVLGNIGQEAAQPPRFARWKDLSKAKTAEQCCFIIHDIARQDIGGLESLRAAISQQVAQEKLRLVAPLPLEGKSAGVRDVIAAYASG